MKKFKYILASIAVAALVGCGTSYTVPLTNRKTHIANEASILSLSSQQYNQFIAKSTKSTNTAQVAEVNRVGRRLASAVETFLRQNGYASEIPNYKWEFNLIENKEVNAFCMPGGKIVVYTGLLPVTKSESELAVVLGHEIAHAVAKHSAQQINKQQNQQNALAIGSVLLGSTVGSDITDIATNVASTAFGYANLKYSRSNESEADHMGLIFAAMAGYDPASAVSFWKRMASSSSSASQTYISDHPSDAQRVADIQRWLPEAEKYYKPSTSTLKISSSKKSSTKKRSSSRRHSKRRR